MKPLKLKMQAFGSYGEETLIDFEKVNLENGSMYYPILGGLDFIDVDEIKDKGEKKLFVNAEKIFEKLGEKGWIEK